MKKWGLILCILMLAMLFGCSEKPVVQGGLVPENEAMPIEGLWRVNHYYGEGYSSRAMDNFELDMGDACLFREEAVYIGGKYLCAPSFRVRNVPTNAYLVKTYRTNISPSIMPSERVAVVNISSKEGEPFAELIQVAQGQMLLAVDQGFYLLEQEQRQVSQMEVERFICAEDAINRDLITRRQRNVRTGFLFSVKIPKEKETFVYRSYYLAMTNGKPQQVYCMPEVIFPRKNGFWDVEIRDIAKTSSRVVTFSAFDGEVETSSTLSQKHESISLTRGELLFVGADFVSLRYQEEDRYVDRIIAIDNLSLGTPLRLDDLVQGGKEKYILAEQNALNGIAPALGEDEGLFIARDKGYWTMRGSRYITEENGEAKRISFPIHAAVPLGIVQYDQNILPWSEMKWILPEIQDAFYSPNQECLVAFADKELLIYRVNERKINKEPIFSMPMEENATVVMTEWSSDHVVDRWTQLAGSRGEICWVEGD